MKEPRPITRIELSDKNKTLRLVAAILLLVIGAVGITIGITSLLHKDTGWQRVQLNLQDRSCSENFILQYNFSGSGAEATTVNNKIQSVYGPACVKSYQLFTPDETIDGVNNIYYVNHRPNEVITVDPVLYAAFEKLEGTPWLYLGPVYEYYYSVIYNADESLIYEMDPMTSPDAAAYVEKIADFAADRNAVNLELLGENRVKLHISQEYLAFAKAEEIENFIDFGYMTNAFIIDYLADEMIAAGLTDGYLVSADGYTRNLDSKHRFSFNLFDRIEDTVYPAGILQYRGPISLVYLKDYPTANSDSNYRENIDHFVHLLADPNDGICRTAEENLVSYSYNMGCADVMLRMLSGFVGDDFAVPQDVFSIWMEEDLICYNDDSVQIINPLDCEEITYRVILRK